MGKHNQKSRYGLIDRMLRGYIAQDGRLFLAVAILSFIFWALCLGAWIMIDFHASLNDSWQAQTLAGFGAVFATLGFFILFFGWIFFCWLVTKRIENKLTAVMASQSGSDEDCLMVALRTIAAKIGQSDFSPYFFHQFHQIRRWWWIKIGQNLPDYSEFKKERKDGGYE